MLDLRVDRYEVRFLFFTIAINIRKLEIEETHLGIHSLLVLLNPFLFLHDVRPGLGLLPPSILEGLIMDLLFLPQSCERLIPRFDLMRVLLYRLFDVEELVQDSAENKFVLRSY
jgi:hypothetical protein